MQAIFKRCGPITQSSVKQTVGGGDVTVRLTFKQEKDAREAVRVFDNQVADGRTLGVRVVGGVNASLSGRLSARLNKGGEGRSMQKIFWMAMSAAVSWGVLKIILFFTGQSDIP